MSDDEHPRYMATVPMERHRPRLGDFNPETESRTSLVDYERNRVLGKTQAKAAKASAKRAKAVAKVEAQRAKLAKAEAKLNKAELGEARKAEDLELMRHGYKRSFWTGRVVPVKESRRARAHARRLHFTKPGE
jgi:hypothetical protein